MAASLPQPDDSIDTLGLYCPVPIWEAAKRMKDMRPGQVLEVISDDEGIVEDMPTWCRRTGHQLLSITQEGETFRVLVKKAG